MDIFKYAMRMEKDGENYYRQLAGQTANGGLKAILVMLADVGFKLDERYHGLELPAKFKLGVSGCPNQCAETCIKDVGFVGMPKGWKILVGGNGGGKG